MAMKFGTDIHGPQGMKRTNFGDPLTSDATLRLKFCFLVKCLHSYCMDGALKMSPNDFGDGLLK